jgi:aminoglycoside 3-N-acetyltransferase
VDSWRDLGLRAGDHVLVHSSLKSLGLVAGGPETVLDSLLTAVHAGWPTRGTLLFPTFNFDFCTSGTFDPRLTPSQMGVLSETARRDPRFRRTQHPIYSFAVHGQDAEWLATRRYASAYGPQSVFAWCYWVDAWIVMVGVPWNNSFTFVHHVEEMEGCTYRSQKSFVGDVVGVGRDTYTLFVRDLDRGVLTQVNPMGAAMEAAGLARVRHIGQAKVVAVRARAAYEYVAAILRAGTARGLLYAIDPVVRD